MKPICLIQSPMATRSGYGDMSRDIVRHIIDLDRYDVRLISMGWGMTPLNALDDVKDKKILDRCMQPPFQLERQPELFIQVAIPNEFQKIGKYNIGITAGIETNMCSEAWLEGCNRMDAVFTTSKHSRDVFLNTNVHHRDPAGNVVKEIKLNVPIEVLHNCVNLDVFHKTDSADLDTNIKKLFMGIPEDFCFLFVGHWLRGGLGEDRKNVGILIKTFLETFKNSSKQNRPALVLKTSGAGFSLLDRKEIRDKIQQLKDHVGGDLPNIYLVHGDLTEVEMNSLYNHPKVKAHVSFTKGEGFGRPLLEASMSKKPIIASGWSGHLDFLNPTDAILVGGEVRQIENGSVWDGVLIRESAWFNVDPKAASGALMFVFKNYARFLDGAARLAKKNKEEFSYKAILKQTDDLLQKYVPTFAMPRQMKLPELKVFE